MILNICKYMYIQPGRYSTRYIIFESGLASLGYKFLLNNVVDTTYVFHLQYRAVVWTFAWNWESGESVIYSYILVPPKIENDHNFVFFGYKVTIQQHFKSRLFWKTKCQEAENSRISGDPWVKGNNILPTWMKSIVNETDFFVE